MIPKEITFDNLIEYTFGVTKRNQNLKLVILCKILKMQNNFWKMLCTLLNGRSNINTVENNVYY